MTTILGIDLGKFKSVCCLFCQETGAIRYETLPTNPERFRAFLEREAPAMTLFETSTAAGWVADLCTGLGLAHQVANPLGEAGSGARSSARPTATTPPSSSGSTCSANCPPCTCPTRRGASTAPWSPSANV
jgi:hypothetical protein